MDETSERIQEFVLILANHARRKADLYNGANNAVADGLSKDRADPDFLLRLATEELGEVASALTRNRLVLARHECIDLAHCALLLWLALGT